jgi:hypothetical protein
MPITYNIDKLSQRTRQVTNKQMKTRFNLWVLIFLCPLMLMGQSKGRDNQFLGYIITVDSVRREVAIEVEDIKQPWSFQQDVKYFDKNLLNGSRVKRELKKDCIPGEVIEYGFQDRRFIYVQYYIKGADEDNRLKEAFGKFKGEKNIDFFAELIQQGEVSAARFHIPPQIGEDDVENAEVMQEHIDKCKDEFDILISRKGFTPVSISDVSFKDFFLDCPIVVKKYEEKRYKIQPATGIKDRVVSIFNPDKLMGDKLQIAVNTIMRDYQNLCKK